MLQAFSEYIKKEKLFPLTGKILLTVSGGIDSIVMCELFHKAKINFAIAHCNFKLRDKESDQDELFVEHLAEKYAVPFHSVSFDTNTFAKKNKISIQLAARKLRYEWFEFIREQFKYNAIATAHHKNDSIETFLINLIRGTGISGLHGILPKQGKIVRPLLFTDKDQIISFSKTHKLKHREDQSNSSDKYLRNKIRLQIIPALKELNPKIDSVITEDISRLREVEIILKKEINKARKNIIVSKGEELCISISKLKKLDPINTYLYELLRPYNFNASVVKDIIENLEKSSGKQFFSDTHRLIKDRENLIIVKISDPETDPFIFEIKGKEKEITVGQLKLSLSKINRDSKFKFPKTENSAVLDLEKLKFPLSIRKWQQGDTFQPLGMKGKKKLSDFFIDLKLSLTEKENVFILLSDNKIAWIIGYRIDDRFKVTDKTNKIYFAELSK